MNRATVRVMALKRNPRQRVLRRDTATGMTLAGWDDDLPIGRFEHLALIDEVAIGDVPAPALAQDHSPFACAVQRAREANAQRIVELQAEHAARGHRRVPFTLGHPDVNPCADEFGRYSDAAMQLGYALSGHQKQVWVVEQQQQLVHVRARFPQKRLDELTLQVWYYQQLHQLQQFKGQILEGQLLVCDSGLWFVHHTE